VQKQLTKSNNGRLMESMVANLAQLIWSVVQGFAQIGLVLIAGQLIVDVVNFAYKCFFKGDITSSFELRGTINGDVPEMIYLDYGNTKDSSVISTNIFKFSGKVEISIVSYFYVSGISSMVDDYFYLENNLIDIKLTISKKT
jgi:hypothetical protein